MTRSTTIKQRVRERKKGAFGAEIPHKQAIAKAKKHNAIVKHGIDHTESMEYADKLHADHEINNDIMESGLL